MVLDPENLYTARSFTTEDLHSIKSFYFENGFVVLKQVLDRTFVEATRQRVMREFVRLNQNPDKLSATSLKHLLRSEMPLDLELAPIRLDPSIYRHLTSSVSLRYVIESLLEEPYYWHFPTMFRTMSAQDVDGLLPFHQDYSYNQRYSRMMVCWVAFDPSGVEAPGLELVRHRFNQRFPHESSGRWEHGVRIEEIPGFSSYSLAQPKTEPGDVVLFDELTLHRTYARQDMRLTRLSQDARAVPLSAIDPETAKSRKFVFSDKTELVRL